MVVGDTFILLLLHKNLITTIKVIIEKSCGEVSLLEPDTIECFLAYKTLEIVFKFSKKKK